MRRFPSDRALDRLRTLAAAQARGLRELWQTVERLEASLADERGEREALERDLADLKRAATAPDAQRVPLPRAARLLGASRQHALRLGVAGVLDVADVSEPGAARATWSVGLASLERLLEERRGERPGRVGQETAPETGHQPRDSGKGG